MLKKDLKKEFVSNLCQDSDAVLQFLADIKWGEGYVCRKCGHTNFCSGKTTASRRCTRCKKEESASAYTIFHNCKFPVNKAFEILYRTCLEEKKMTTANLSAEFGLNPMTCWKFRKKITNCIKRQQSKNKDEIDIVDILLDN